jgi:type I restriction enzyme R subunit
VLYHKDHLPIAIVEAKDNSRSVGDGMQQALGYAETLDIPFVYSSNGDGFLEHDRTKTAGQVEREFHMEEFPSPEDLYRRYRVAKGLDEEIEKAIMEPYYEDGSGKGPRYYQQVAINRTVEAVAK